MDYRARRRLYLALYNKAHLPRKLTTALVKLIGFLGHPIAWWVRREAGSAALQVKTALEVPQATGYVKLEQEQLPHIQDAIADCRAIYAGKMAEGFQEANRDIFRKPFLISLTESCDELLEYKGIRQFALSPELIAVACRYFGTMPILSEVQLWWTPANDTMLKSQKFHLDAEDYRQLKVFLHIEPVDESCGPFTLIPAEATRKVCAMTGYAGGRRERVEDEPVERIARSEIDRVMGPAGSGVLVDTSRCLHYGSRGNRKERLVLFLQFISYYAPKLEPYDWKQSPIARQELSAAERLLLRI
jgi:hypothetical protein